MNENEDMKNADDISEDRIHALEEIIIDNNKRLISANNRYKVILMKIMLRFVEELSKRKPSMVT